MKDKKFFFSLQYSLMKNLMLAKALIQQSMSEQTPFHLVDRPDSSRLHDVECHSRPDKF